MTMIGMLSNALVLAGAAVLIGALIPLRYLIKRLPHGIIASKWSALQALVVLFVVGYLGYSVAFWGHHVTWSDVIVPGVFLFGAIFVWVVAQLSLQTATDLRRVALLEQENIPDPLIGIYNRRYLDRRLDEEVARARRYGHPLSVLMLDIDHFKRVNDTYGHQAGDEVLKHLGKLIMSAVRETDIVARYGGEEIFVISPDASLETAVMLAERLRRHTEAHELVLTSETSAPRVIRVTVSIGVASFDPSLADGAGLMRNADEALYEAKGAGRNRVHAYKAAKARGVGL